MKITTFILVLMLIINSHSKGQWVVQNLSGARSTMAAASGGDKAIFAGGIGLITIPPPDFDMYNYSLGSWTNGSISRGRHDIAGAA